MASNGNSPASMRLLDYSDRELLLLVIEECAADADGFASTKDIADAVGLKGDHRLSMMGSRLAVLRRLGAIEKASDPDISTRGKGVSMWTVSPIGQMMATGDIPRAAQNALDKLKPEAMLHVTRYLTRQYIQAPDTVGHLIRREWVHGTHRW